MVRDRPARAQSVEGIFLRAVTVDSPGPVEALVLRDVPVPRPHQGEVLVQVACAGVNYADVKRRQGTSPGGASVNGFVPGIEVSGRVVELGPGAPAELLGRRVLGLCNSGGYAEHLAVPADWVHAIPDHMTDIDAAALGVVGLTSLLCLTRSAGAGHPDVVLVTSAAGGVGSAAVQVARALGVAAVVGAASSAGKRDVVASLGADHYIDYENDDLEEAAGRYTEGRGFDVVLDARGGEVRRAAIGSLAPFGRLVHYGNSSGEPELVPSPVDQRERLMTLTGFSLRRCRLTSPSTLREGWATLVGMIERGDLRPQLQEVLPLAQVQQAHTLIESGSVRGKIVLQVGRSQTALAKGTRPNHV